MKSSKVVTIDQTWHMLACYEQVIRLKNDADMTKYREIRLPGPVSFREIRKATAVAETGSGDRILATHHNNRLTFKQLSVPATLTIAFTVATHYQDMNGFFVDVFNGGGAIENYYKVTFPASRDFQCCVQPTGSPKIIRSVHGNTFEWNKPGSNTPTVVKISTIKKWDRIQMHYAGVYEKTIQEGLLSDIWPSISQWRQEKDEPRRRRVFEYIHEKVRYRSHLEKGAPLTPARPDDVLNRGWGDCKDLSVLTVKLLRLLGFEAYPVLCAPTDKVDWHWPDPFVFNHAIVKLIVDGEDRYYDPSRGQKRVPQSVLENIYMLPLTFPDI